MLRRHDGVGDKVLRVHWVLNVESREPAPAEAFAQVFHKVRIMPLIKEQGICGSAGQFNLIRDTAAYVILVVEIRRNISLVWTHFV